MPNKDSLKIPQEDNDTFFEWIRNWLGSNTMNTDLNIRNFSLQETHPFTKALINEMTRKEVILVSEYNPSEFPKILPFFPELINALKRGVKLTVITRKPTFTPLSKEHVEKNVINRLENLCRIFPMKLIYLNDLRNGIIVVIDRAIAVIFSIGLVITDPKAVKGLRNEIIVFQSNWWKQARFTFEKSYYSKKEGWVRGKADSSQLIVLLEIAAYLNCSIEELKIEIKDERITKLSLPHRTIRETSLHFPKSIKELKFLESIEILPPYIEETEISGSDKIILREMEAEINSAIPRLNSFFLNDVEIPLEADIGFVEENGYITKLYLTSFNLTSIPNSVSKFSNLQLLDLSNTRIGVPDILKSLNNSKSLHQTAISISNLGFGPGYSSVPVLEIPKAFWLPLTKGSPSVRLLASLFLVLNDQDSEQFIHFIQQLDLQSLFKKIGQIGIILGTRSEWWNIF